MAVNYLRQIKVLRENLDNQRMSPREVYEALMALENAFSSTMKRNVLPLQKVGDFYSEYESLQEECEDSMDRGLLEEVLIGE